MSAVAPATVIRTTALGANGPPRGLPQGLLVGQRRLGSSASGSLLYPKPGRRRRTRRLERRWATPSATALARWISRQLAIPHQATGVTLLEHCSPAIWETVFAEYACMCGSLS